MQSSPPDGKWFGSTENPRTQKELRKLKHALVDGAVVILREQLEKTQVKQGPREHKRVYDEGLVISVAPYESESNNLAKWIENKKYAFISRGGSTHPEYPTVSSYLAVDTEKGSVSTVPKLEISQETIDMVENKSLNAALWGFAATALRGSFWCARHIAGVRVLVAFPVMVFVFSLAGLTPAVFSTGTQWALRVLGLNELADTIYVSQLMVTNLWFWRFLVGAMLWQALGLFISSRTFFQETKPGNPTAKPVAAKNETSPKKKKISEASSKDSGEDDPWLGPARLNSCLAGHILLEGKPDARLEQGGCEKPASFIAPVAGADSIADYPGKKNGEHYMSNVEVCALCPIHMRRYQPHISECTCSTIGCDLFGRELTTPTEAKRLCSDHAKKLLTKTQPTDRSKSPPLTRGREAQRANTKDKKEEDGDSNMPPLEPIPKVEVNKWSEPSESMSTGSTHSILANKLKEIGGRTTPNLPGKKGVICFKPESKHRTDQESSTSSDRTSHRRSSDHRSTATTVKLGRRDRRRKRSVSSTPFSTSSDSKIGPASTSSSHGSSSTSEDQHQSSSDSASSSIDSPRRRRKSKHRSGRNRRLKPSNTPSFQSPLPKGLCHAKIRNTRHAVRGRDELSTQMPSRGKYEAIVDHLGAVRDREDKKAGGFCKTDQFMVVALRGSAFIIPPLAPEPMERNLSRCGVDRERVNATAFGNANFVLSLPIGLPAPLPVVDSVTTPLKGERISASQRRIVFRWMGPSIEATRGAVKNWRSKEKNPIPLVISLRRLNNK